MATTSESGAPQRQVHVLLTLHNGERSFGMSLAQKVPAIGPKYTVVSSVFADSPADRAGVRTGYVVRSINDKPMNGLAVAQVASHFRNASQARITLEVVETAASPRTSAFTAQATFGGLATLSNKSAGSTASLRAGTEQRTATPVTGFSAVSSGRAIAAPGTALSVPSVAAPKQPVLRLGAKRAAKTLAAAGAASSTTASLASSSAATRTNGSLAMPTAEPKRPSGANRDGLKSKAVAPVLRLGPKPKRVQPTAATELVNGSATQVDRTPQAKSVPAKPPIAAPAAMGNGSESRNTPQSSVSVSRSSSAQAPPAQANPVTIAAQVKPKPTPTAPAIAVAAVSSPPKVMSAPAAKATASSAAAPAKKLVSGPASHPVVIPAAIVAPTPVASAQPSTVAPASASQKKTTLVSSTAQVPVAKPSSTVTSSVRTANSSSQAPAIPSSVHATNSLPTSVQKPATSSPKPAPPQPSRVVVAPPTHPPEPAEVTARRRPPPVVVPMPQADPATNRIPPPVPTPVRTTTMVTRSAPAPAAAAASTTPKKKAGKKRGRARTNPEASNGTPGRKGKAKAKAKAKVKRPPPREESDEELDGDIVDEELSALYPFYSFSDEEQSPSPKRGRRRGVTDRPRHSLTVERLIGMGFTKEDAEASVVEIGDDPENCMLWIISKIEERQFTDDLNQASIESEESKRDEEERVKEMQRETLARVEQFMTIFPSSYIAGADSSASRLKKVLESTINQVSAESSLRKVLTDLLTLEGKSIRWYKQAARSYMLELAERLETALGAHDVVTCCGASESCAFVKTIVEEVKALKKALYEMPTNQGGVPPVFLECDETTKFDLDDDGFEVVE